MNVEPEDEVMRRATARALDDAAELAGVNVERVVIALERLADAAERIADLLTPRQ